MVSEIIAVISVIAGLVVLAVHMERSRREFTVNLICSWSNGADWTTTCAINLAGKLEEASIAGILDKKRIRVAAEHHAAVVAVLEEAFQEKDLPALKEDDIAFVITEEQSSYIRFLWIRWLNRLEGVLSAWQQGAVDMDHMAKEFSPLVIGHRAELNIFAMLLPQLPVLDEFRRQILQSGRLVVKAPILRFKFSST